MEIVKRSDDMKGFVVLPRRWVVERTFSWFGRNRRFEGLREPCRNPGHLRYPRLHPTGPQAARQGVIVMVEVCKASMVRRPSPTPRQRRSRADSDPSRARNQTAGVDPKPPFITTQGWSGPLGRGYSHRAFAHAEGCSCSGEIANLPRRSWSNFLAGQATTANCRLDYRAIRGIPDS
jgi:transposase